jgi:hypothetical protein
MLDHGANAFVLPKFLSFFRSAKFSHTNTVGFFRKVPIPAICGLAAARFQPARRPDPCGLRRPPKILRRAKLLPHSLITLFDINFQGESRIYEITKSRSRRGFSYSYIASVPASYKPCQVQIARSQRLGHVPKQGGEKFSGSHPSKVF